MKKIFFFLAAILIGCSPAKKNEDKRPLLLVTIPAYEEIVREIGNGRFRVHSAIPQGANQHLYDPSPREMAALEQAQIWFGIGEHIEENLIPSLREQNPHFTYVNLANTVTPIEHGRHVDRHIWMDPIGMIDQAAVVYQTLLNEFPEYHDALKAGYEKVKATLKLVNSEISERLKPYGGDAILVSHAAFGYFCKRYDLVQLSIETEGKAPLPRDIEALTERFDKQKIRCVLIQEQHNEKGARYFAKELNLPIYEVDPAGPDYYQMLRSLAEDIAR